ncbi:MAG TPA: serine hydrolase, partial [Aquabacterium sp.]|nr:serine hydrolase [Aquabacterium sp.]
MMVRHVIAPRWIAACLLCLSLGGLAVAQAESLPDSAMGTQPALQAAAPLNWAPLDAAVEAQIQAGQLPGAVLIWGDAQGIRLERTWGRRAVVPQSEAMTTDTVFDLASLTKVIATTTSILQLVDKGRLQLDAPAARYWPAFGVFGKERITLRQLLAHTSGLRPDLDLRPDWQGTAQALKRVIAERPLTPPGSRTIYSDINFIVLGQIVERVSHMPLRVYARQKIFQPLHMHDTGFLPPHNWQRRIAPTESIQPGSRKRGIVHDPTARRMDRVAGHAGLFGTAEDLARFAQAMLEPGRLLKAGTLAELQQRQNPALDSDSRGLGWQLMAPLVANRDNWPPLGMIGHTGYTGTGLWIDLTQKQFVILLSNRVHPDGRGDARPLRRQVLALLSSVHAPLPPPPHPEEGMPAPEGVLTGSDVLRAQGFASLIGHRVGLITNLAAIDRQGWRTLDRLRWAPGVTLVKVFSPEHGLYGDAEGAIPSGREPISQLPLISLYGEHKRPTPDSLRDIDTLVFDLQDAGARFFTYISTLAEAMRAAAEQGIRVVVLDRPDPIRADRVAGPVLEPGLASFTGYPGLPVEHGMTVGELARWFQDDLRQKGLSVALEVVPMQGYRRSLWFDQTRADWVPPSPNLRRPLTAILYPGVSWIEGANVSVGRGTEHPFEWVGAPWIDGPRLAEALTQAGLPGVRFEATQFTPRAGPYQDKLCNGVMVQLLDRNAFDATTLGALLVRELYRLWPDT